MFFVASAILSSIPLKCCSGVCFNWYFKWFNDPLVNRFWTFAPASIIHWIETPLSTKVKISTRSRRFTSLAHFVMLFTALNSPSDTRAEATSIRSTFSSPSRSFASVSFSEDENDTPDVCSPSRRVVSIISIVFGFMILGWNWIIEECFLQIPQFVPWCLSNNQCHQNRWAYCLSYKNWYQKILMFPKLQSWWFGLEDQW